MRTIPNPIINKVISKESWALELLLCDGDGACATVKVPESITEEMDVERYRSPFTLASACVDALDPKRYAKLSEQNSEVMEYDAKTGGISILFRTQDDEYRYTREYRPDAVEGGNAFPAEDLLKIIVSASIIR